MMIFAAPFYVRLAYRLAGTSLLLLVTLNCSAQHMANVVPTTLTVVTDDNYPPYIQRDEEGLLSGYLVDIWALWESKTGVHVNLVATEWAKAQQLMEARQAEVIDTIFETSERVKKLDFTSSYATIPVSIYTHTSITGIANLKSLRGFSVGVKKGDACIDKLKVAGINTLQLFDSYQALIQGAIEQKVRVFCIDEPPANYLIYRSQAENNFRKAFSLYTGYFHRAVHKGDAATLSLVESGFAKMSSHELEDLHNKWMGSSLDQFSYAKYLRMGLGGVLLLVLISIVWVWMLRRKVAQKTVVLVAQQQELIESRNLLMTIIDTVPMRVFWKNRELNYLGCNSVFAKDGGMQNYSDVIGKNDFQMGWASQAKRYRADDEAVIASGEAKLYYDEPQTTPAGNLIWLRTSKVPLKNVAGEIFGLLGTYEDITERKENEDAVRRSEERFRFMLENSPIAVRISNIATSQVVFANQRYAELIESKSNQVKGVNPRQFYANPEVYDEVIEQLGKGEQVTNRLIELHIPASQIKTKWVLASYVLVEYQNESDVLGWFYDISDRKKMEEQVQHLAHYDALTDLPNRTLFSDRLHQALAIAKRDQSHLAVMFIDLDKFKPVNDTLGHDVGDLLLKSVAQRVQDCLRESDTVARIGGDEFIVLLPFIDTEQDALRVAEKIRFSLNQPFVLADHQLEISSSIGISIYPEHGTEERQLIKNADVAMYFAKSDGRDNVKAFRSDMSQLNA
jgi:diguanylate cyclase (GGDEF)-like protein/PAS domain S-box-containing protein